MRIVLLSGGDSDEAPISRRSGAAVAAALESHPHRVETVAVDPADTPLRPDDFRDGDVLLNLLHGAYGEDGAVQQWAADHQVCLTGCDAASSALTFDKARTRDRLRRRGVPTPAGFVAHAGDALPAERPYPLVVKPSCSGSSVGLSLVRSPADWAAALAVATPHGDAVVEEYLDGPEWSVTLLGTQPLPPIRVQTPSPLFDQTAKYASESSTFTPLPLDRANAQPLCDLAVQAAEACDTRGLVRVDLRASDRDPDDLRVLEINTVPGMTERSLSPLAAMAAGMTLGELAWWMVDDARQRAADFG